MKTPKHLAQENARQWGSDIARDRMREQLTVAEAAQTAGIPSGTLRLLEDGDGPVVTLTRCLDAYGESRPYLAESIAAAAREVYGMDRDSDGFATALACMSERRLRNLASGAGASMAEVGALVLVLGWDGVIGRGHDGR